MQREYEVKPGDSREKVAKLFGVSVGELLDYNSAVLGGSWEAGTVVRDPSYIRSTISDLRKRGVKDEAIADALNITEKQLVSKYGPPNKPAIKTEPEPNSNVDAVPAPNSKKVDVRQRYADLNKPDKPPSNPAVELGRLNIEDYAPKSIPLGVSDFDFGKANRGMLSEITDLPSRVPEEALARVSVPERGRVPTEALAPITPTQRGQIPIPQPAPPAPARKPLFTPQSEPRLESELTGMLTGSMSPPEAPPLPELQEVTATQRGQIPLPTGPSDGFVRGQRLGRLEVQQPPDVTARIPAQSVGSSNLFDADEPFTPAPNAIVEEEVTEALAGPKRRGWGEPVSENIPPKLPDNFDFNMSAVREAAQKKVKKDTIQKKGITRSIMEGLTFDLYDEASAYATAREEGIPYEIARRRYMMEQQEFELMNPNLSMGLELGSSIIPGVGGFKALEQAGNLVTRLDSARKARQFTTGKRQVDYTNGRTGKVEKVTVVKDMGDGRVNVIGADGKRKRVSKNNITVEPDEVRGAEVGNKTLGAIEGGFWGFNSGGEDNDRMTTAVVGGVAGLTMGAAIDVFRAPQYRDLGDGADDEMMTVSGIYMPEVVQNIRNQASRALADAQEARANPVADDGIAAMFGEPAPSPAPFSYIDKFNESPLAKKEKRTGLAGAWDATVEKYKNWAMGVSDRIMLDFSPEWGARIQSADETALRTLAREITLFADPVADVLDLEINDLYFRGMMLDYAKGEASLDTITNYVASRLGNKSADNLRRYIVWADGKNQEHIYAITGKSYDAPTYLSTRLSPTAKASKKNSMEVDIDLPDDPGLLSRTRGNFKDNKPNQYDVVDPTDYLPVLATNLRRISNNERMVQMAKKMNMPIVKDMQEVDDFFKAMERHVIDMGLDADLAKRGTILIKDNLIGQGRSPHLLLQALNSFGYATTLAGPISAILNLHDPMVASVKYGFGNTMKGIAQPAYDVRGRGIDQNVGEFMNKMIDMYANDRAGFNAMIADAMRTGTDWLMKGSGFAAMDNMGKSGTIKSILNHASEVAAKDSKTKWKNKREQFTDGKLARQWGFYFNKYELEMIHKELMKHGSDFDSYSGKAASLLEELAFAGLGQQQLISGMGRPSAWARHPNLRPMWALRGFAIKQQALILREILFNIAQGRTDEALKFMARYVALAAGSFGLLNEARQWVFGDGEASILGFLQGAADQIVSTMSLNTIGLNDYQYGRLMESGPIPVVAESLMPLPAQRIYDISKAMYQGATDPEKQFRTELLNEIPVTRQIPNAIQNLAENTDHLIPKPLEDLEERLRPGEQR